MATNGRLEFGVINQAVVRNFTGSWSLSSAKAPIKKNIVIVSHINREFTGWDFITRPLASLRGFLFSKWKGVAVFGSA